MTDYQKAVKMYGQERVNKHLQLLFTKIPTEIEFYKDFIESFYATGRDYQKTKRLITIHDIYNCGGLLGVSDVKYAIIKLIYDNDSEMSTYKLGRIFKCDNSSISYALRTFNDRLSIRDEYSVRVWETLQNFMKNHKLV